MCAGSSIGGVGVVGEIKIARGRVIAVINIQFAKRRIYKATDVSEKAKKGKWKKGQMNSARNKITETYCSDNPEKFNFS